MVMLKEKLKKENGALARASSIRTGARKLNVVAASIRGKNAAAALVQLRFEKRRIAKEVRKVLQAAVANAENNHGLDVDRLYVAEAWVGRALVMKRMHTRGRGRSAGIEKPFSNLTIVVRERAEAEKPAKKSENKEKSVKSKSSKPKAAEQAAEAKE
jgi:large subunit ribosomal protein L22